MSQALLLVLLALCAARVTRLLTTDTLPLFARPRDWLEAKLPGAWADLPTCGWCAGVYVTGAVVLVTDRYASVRLPVLVWGAAAYLVGWLSGHEG